MMQNPRNRDSIHQRSKGNFQNNGEEKCQDNPEKQIQRTTNQLEAMIEELKRCEILLSLCMFNYTKRVIVLAEFGDGLVITT